MLCHAFDFLKLNRVEFKIDERNQASRRAVEKIGGQLEGILKKHTILSDGHLRNTCYYSIIDDSWPGLKNEIFRDLILQNGKR
jgi:RimJ/RimL family protein N-acetyltransferase